MWFAAVLAIVLVAMLVSFGLGDQVGWETNSTDAFAATARSLVQIEEAAPRSPATKTIASVLPSVVNVRVVEVGASASGQVGEAKAEGSGVVIAPNGVIVTNDHVVQGAVQVRVVFTDGHPTMPGTVRPTARYRRRQGRRLRAQTLRRWGDRASSRSQTPSKRSDSPSTSV